MSRPDTHSAAVGAAWGLVAWTSYAVVEFVLCGVWPLLTTERAVFTPLYWTLTLWLMVAYGVAGGLCGVVAARLPGASLRTAGALSLYLAVMLNGLRSPDLNDGGKPLLVLASVLLLTTAWALLRPSSRLAPWLKIPPVLAAFLILGPSWLSREVIDSPGLLVRRALLLSLVVGVVAVSRLLARFADWSAARHLAMNVALLALAVGTSAVVSGRNRSLPPIPENLAANPGLPPVILVTFDTTRADHMSVYGYSRKTTPQLEELARQATLYTDAVAASNWTLPSHASIFTGAYPSWHGARTYAEDPAMPRPLDDRIPTLAQILRARGVFTAAVSANKFYLAPEWGLDRGFQSFNTQMPVEMLPLLHSYYLRDGMRELLSCCMDTIAFDQQCRSAGEISADAVATLAAPRLRNRSFFLFVNYMDAHWPYVAPVPDGVPLPSGRGAPSFARLTAIMDDLLLRHVAFPEPQHRLTLERYDAGIAAEDAGLRDLVRWLKARGLYDAALIIVTSDHGEGFGEHGLMGHGLSSYQDQVRVPLLIKFPQQTTARTVRTPVSHVDILPTVLDTLGIAIPNSAQGMSLRNAAENRERDVVTEAFPTYALTRPKLVFSRTQRAFFRAPYKLMVSDQGKPELFDVEGDPLELHNLAPRGLPEAAGLESAFEDWLRTVPAQPARNAVDPKQLKRLKGLGYVR